MVATLLTVFQLIDLVINDDVIKICQKHLFLLVDKLSGVLGALLLQELQTRLGDHHSKIKNLALGN